jgi:transposase
MTAGHRLNRGGHRQANAALYRTVIVRMQHHEPTRAYVARRIAEGKTEAEIICCLKRPPLPRNLGTPAPASRTTAAPPQAS